MVVIESGWIGVDDPGGPLRMVTLGQVIARLVPPFPRTSVNALTDVAIRVLSYLEAIELIAQLPHLGPKLVAADPTLEFARFYKEHALMHRWPTLAPTLAPTPQAGEGVTVAHSTVVGVG